MEPKQIPEGVSPVRAIMAETNPEMPYHPIKTFEAARQHPDGVAVLEADYGTQLNLPVAWRTD
jgi:hypothetical protein